MLIKSLETVPKDLSVNNKGLTLHCFLKLCVAIVVNHTILWNSLSISWTSDLHHSKIKYSKASFLDKNQLNLKTARFVVLAVIIDVFCLFLNKPCKQTYYLH